MTPRLRRWMLATVVLLAAAWFVLPGRQLPLYDGIGFPDEPYRYVTRPAGETKVTAPPTELRLDVKLTQGVSDAAFGQSAEQGPQVAVFITRGAIRPSPGSARMQVHITPHAPTVQPAKGSIYGNVYRIDVTGGELAPPAPGSLIRLRAPRAVLPMPVVHVLVDGTWTPLKTDRVGTDIYSASLVHGEEFAVVRTAASKGSGGGTSLLLILGGGLLLVLAAVIGLVRVRRGRAQGAGR